MQPNDERPATIMPQTEPTSSPVLRADDRTRHHRKLMIIAALALVTILVALAVVAWFVRQAEIKNQTLHDEYQAQSFQASAQEAKAFFAANPPSSNPKAMAASEKTATAFFKANPPTQSTSAQIAAQSAQLQAMQAQGFQSWKAAQPNQ